MSLVALKATSIVLSIEPSGEVHTVKKQDYLSIYSIFTPWANTSFGMYCLAQSHVTDYTRYGSQSDS